MKVSKTEIKDPICGMVVDESSSFHAEHDGKTFYFCGRLCKEKFLATPIGAKPEEKSGGCCK